MHIRRVAETCLKNHIGQIPPPHCVRPRRDLRDVNNARPNATVEKSSPQKVAKRKLFSAGPCPLVNGFINVVTAGTLQSKNGVIRT